MPQSAIVLVMDGLGAGFLGPYGNTWIETPFANELAANSLLCEFAYADSPQLETLYRSFWWGRHAACRAPDDIAASLATRCAEQGIDTLLVTDEPRVAGHRGGEDFALKQSITLPTPRRPARMAEQTTLAQLMAAAVDHWQEAAHEAAQAGRGALMWLHLRGMYGPWDAPLEYRQQFVEEDDPEPSETVVPPRRFVTEEIDPDELWGIAQSYAGQVVLFDQCLGALLDAVDRSPLAETTALWLTAARGFPLGEHRRVGSWDDALYGEVLQVPWMWRLPRGANYPPNKAMEPQRLPAIVQPADGHATLAEWLELSPSPPGWGGRSLLPAARGEIDVEATFDRACAVAAGEAALRAPGWFLREKTSSSTADATDSEEEVIAAEGANVELYVKPDDRWEVNEIASKVEATSDAMRAALEKFIELASKERLDELPALDEDLR